MNHYSFVERLAPEIHLFCPHNDADLDSQVSIVKHEEFESNTGGSMSLASNLGQRLQVFCECLKIYSFEEPHAAPLQDQVRRQVARQLSRCENCVTGYYSTKHKWFSDLRR